MHFTCFPPLNDLEDILMCLISVAKWNSWSGISCWMTFGSTQFWGSVTGWVYKLGCQAAMKVRGDGHLEEGHSLSLFLREIYLILRYFLEHWLRLVGVPTWLQSRHESKMCWPPRGGYSLLCLLRGISLFSGIFFIFFGS